MLFSIHDSAYLLLSIRQITSGIQLEATLQQFILLGVIPGTNYRFELADIVLALWFIGFLIICTMLSRIAYRIASSLDPYPTLPKGMTYFDIIAL